MTITVAAVYEGGGVLKLERPLDLQEKAKVNVTIETAVEAAPAIGDDDPTGWKAAREFIGMWKDAPERSSASLSEDHDRVIYMVTPYADGAGGRPEPWQSLSPSGAISGSSASPPARPISIT
jgi:predicted DNA-binding antitoxin AbrB/MazE fold protein